MYFFGPTMNDRTLSGARTPRQERLDALETRMHEFLAAKGRSNRGSELVERVTAQRNCINEERGKLASG